jgi:unsaturated rhamnogalacturonyl hydrolase
MMYGIFAVQWGGSQGDPALFDFGVAQPGIFASKLQDPATGLFFHAWDEQANQPLGAHWLRGNGWVGTNVVEVLDELPATHPQRPALEQILQLQAKGLEGLELENGLWDSIIDQPGACYAESSGSALVAYALAKGARTGVLKPEARERARHVFASLTERLARRSDGLLSVTGVSGATNAMPAFLYPLVPQEDDVDYGVGAYLLLASELANENW